MDVWSEEVKHGSDACLLVSAGFPRKAGMPRDDEL